MGPPYITMSWIGLTSLTPLSALVLAWTIVSIHRRRTKSILLLAILYAQLFFQFVNFAFATLILLKAESSYMGQLTFAFNFLIIFKSLSVLSLHLEEFYKIKSPSNYLLNISTSLLKYHLLVLVLLSSMGGYLLPRMTLVPQLTDFNEGEGVLVGVVVSFHSMIILISLTFLGVKCLLRKRTLDVDTIIGTNSTSSSANLFQVGGGGSGRGHGRGASGVATINLLINSSLLMSIFWKFWLPPTWPLVSVILWSQVIESLLSPAIYWTATATGGGRRGKSPEVRKRSSREEGRGTRQSGPSSSIQSIRNGSLCFNNGEFQYFAGGKHNSFSSSRETTLNNGGMEASDYNTFDSFHQEMSYTDSFRCASVTTIANDDFEFLPRGQAPPHLQSHPPEFQYYHKASLRQVGPMPSPLVGRVMPSPLVGRVMETTITVPTSLSMNDLDLIGRSSSACESTATNSQLGKCKYKKNGGHKMKRRFGNRSMSRRVLSLESLHSNVNDSHLARWDTGERVIVFTTDFI